VSQAPVPCAETDPGPCDAGQSPLDLLENTEEFEGKASALHAIGLEYASLGQLPRAAGAYKQGLLLSKTHLGVSHKLTRILRNLYIDSSKALALANQRGKRLSGEKKLGRLVRELETPTLEVGKRYSKETVPVIRTKTLTQSIQCGTDETLGSINGESEPLQVANFAAYREKRVAKSLEIREKWGNNIEEGRKMERKNEGKVRNGEKGGGNEEMMVAAIKLHRYVYSEKTQTTAWTPSRSPSVLT
jgi:hypothetical protein